jgi:hypothetical protein
MKKYEICSTKDFPRDIELSLGKGKISPMRKRTFLFKCTDNLCSHLASIVQHYAQAAFPIGGSECAQVSHEALLNIAQNLVHAPADHLAISIHQRAILRSAVMWYFTEVEQNEVLKIQLLKQLQKQG